MPANNEDKLVGVITDGDLRRHLKKDFFNLAARKIMTRKPKLILRDNLVSNALNIMNKNKITCLFVVNDLKDKIPIGIIHIHDCVRYAN